MSGIIMNGTATELVLGVETALTLLIAAILGILAYFIQAILERQARLAERKQEHYVNLFRSIFELFVAEPGDERSVLLSDFERSWLFAPDDVVKACYEFLNFYNDICENRKREGVKIRKGFVCIRSVMLSDREEDIRDKEKMEAIIADIFWAMRWDMKPWRTRLARKWREEHIQLYDWGILARKDKSGFDKFLDGLLKR
jgi:hypothetical protein